MHGREQIAADTTGEDAPNIGPHKGLRPPSDPLLDGLTAPQREAVLHTEGPLLILAAAGSGKTRVITRRIAHLVRTGVAPWSILALTFTNKAAGEMRERVDALLGEGSRATRGLTVTTFHALCARLLRRYVESLKIPGLSSSYTIYDASDQSALMKRIIADADLSTTNWPPQSVLWHVGRMKNELKDAAAHAAEANDFHAKTVARLHGLYEKALRAANAVDFDDLLLLTVRLLRTRPEVLREVRARWTHLLIDEYQDTNHAQFALASAIAQRDDGAPPNICVVGDPDQSIYGWRGADISNILDFEAQFPGARVVTLGENFRSVAPVLRIADTLIRRNRMRKHKDLFTSRVGGETPMVVLCRDEHHEARVVEDWFKSLREGGEGTTSEGGGGAPHWKDMAVFYRTNALSRVMEDALRAGGVPYVIARGTAFYEREEVKDALAYLRIVANPADDVSLLRIVNKPSRGVGATSLNRVREWAAARGVTLFDALRDASGVEGVSARAATAMREFVEMVERWTGAGSFMGAAMSGSLSELAARVVRESGLESRHGSKKNATDEREEERLGNLAELVSSAHEFEQEYAPENDPASDAAMREGAAPTPPLLSMLRAYLESVSLVADADKVDPAHGAVTLMTLHAAKGLEFRAVAMIGVEDGTLPHSRSRDSEAELEEERRLCFVGVTRAQERLLITCAKRRTIHGREERTIPSPFLGEFGRDNVLVSDQTDDWGTHDDRTDDRDWGARLGGDVGGAAPFGVGDLVRHPRFGVGNVLEISGGRASAKARIAFRDAGTKTLILEFAQLKRI